MTDTTEQDTGSTNAEDAGEATAGPVPTAPLRNGAGDLWLDRVARSLGFGRVAGWISPSLKPSYAYAVVMVVGWTLISAGADLFVFGTTPIYVENPYFLLQPLVLVGGVYAAHSLQHSYHRALDHMAIAERTSDPGQFRTLTPAWAPWVLFVLAAGAQLVRFAADFASFTTVGIVANGFVFPFVYAPIIVQFLVIYVGIEFVAPWRLYRSDVGIHFLDPHGVGGLRPLGELVKKAYYYVVAGLIAYALITYAPGVSGWEISTTAGVIFTGTWGLTILTVAFAVLVLHRFMRREKRRELQQLQAEFRERIEQPWDVQAYTVPEDAAADVEDIKRRIKEVSTTREYPATFSIWTQLILSVAIPKALQLFLAST